MTTEKKLAALVQNYGFKRTSEKRLPSINYVYPDYTIDGNSEAFRFSETLNRELRHRELVVRNSLKGKYLVWTTNEEILLGVGKISPRLGLEEQITGKINSVYSYSPILFTGFSQEDLTPYVIKPIIDGSMAWFELTSEESLKIRKLLEEKSMEKPYRTFFQRLFGGKTKTVRREN